MLFLEKVQARSKQCRPLHSLEELNNAYPLQQQRRQDDHSNRDSPSEGFVRISKYSSEENTHDTRRFWKLKRTFF
jgi:hypothetical protein